MMFFKHNPKLPKHIEDEINLDYDGNKEVWQRLDQLESNQKRLTNRLIRIELKSGIFRTRPSGGKG